MPPVAFETVKKVVEAELGKPLSAAFRTFDEEPLAAASVAQVHRATLKDGAAVVVVFVTASQEGFEHPAF